MTSARQDKKDKNGFLRREQWATKKEEEEDKEEEAKEQTKMLRLWLNFKTDLAHCPVPKTVDQDDGLSFSLRS